MKVGEVEVVAANERNPGEIARYLWEAIPPEAGMFEMPEAPLTRVTALAVGDVIIRLTASDGLYQMIAECRTSIIEGQDSAVELRNWS